jgi:hypothetical protein
MISLLITVLILGVIAWAVSAIPMPQPFKVVAYAILVIVLICLVADVLGHPVALYGPHTRLR